MRNIRLGTLLGIPILVNPSWFILFGLFTWLLATQLYPDALEERSRGVHYLLAGLSVIGFFVCVLLHELAHSVVAKLYRIPVRSITLFIFGGVAQITRDAARPFSEFLMALAGPLVSAALGGLFLGAWWAAGGGDSEPLELMLLWLGVMNVAVGVFNLIPAFPMDGGRVFRSFIWLVSGSYNRATSIAGWTGRGIAWAMIGFGIATVLGLEVLVEREPVSGLWLILIGFFLENAARQSLVQNRLLQALRQYKAADLMQTDLPVLEGEATIASVGRVLEINPRACYFVEQNGALAGILTATELRAVPEARWDETTAVEAMRPSGSLKPTTPDRLASDILIDMESENQTHMPVVAEGRVLGLIGLDRIVQVLRQSGAVA